MNAVKSKLTVPSRMSYLAPVVEYVRELARCTGFSDREVHLIHLAVEEAVSNVIRHGYQENPDAVFEIVCEQAATGLTFRIREKGIPFDMAKLADYSPDRAFSSESPVSLGSHLMKQAMDEVTFHNLGRAGKEIRLTKYIGGKHIESYPEEGAGASPVVGAAPTPSAPKRRPGFTVRDLAPGEAIEVSRCAYRTYGYTYDDYIYYPERILDYIRRGLLYSAVAVAEDGQIIGHAALKRSRAEDPIVELGVFFITPEFRGSSVFPRLCSFLKEKVPGLNLKGVFARSISAHTISQRGTALFGFKDCGLLVGVPPEKVEFIDFTAMPRQMGTRVLSFISLCEERERLIHPPEALRERILGLYGDLNIPAVVGRDREGPGREPDGETESVSTKSMTTNVADIEVFEPGENALEIILRHFHRNRLEGAAVIFLHLDLEEPHTATLASAMLAEGFLFAGILPHGLRGRDALILQYLNNLKVEYDLIKLHSPVAKDLLAYVREHDPSAC